MVIRHRRQERMILIRQMGRMVLKSPTMLLWLNRHRRHLLLLEIAWRQASLCHLHVAPYVLRSLSMERSSEYYPDAVMPFIPVSAHHTTSFLHSMLANSINTTHFFRSLNFLECILPWLTERQGCCPLCKTLVLPEEYQRNRRARRSNSEVSSSPRNRLRSLFRQSTTVETDVGVPSVNEIQHDLEGLYEILMIGIRWSKNEE
jgi:hypothetical protein